MINGLVTCVVPVYNVEKYLDRCLESIVCQTYRDQEIILVDDGSPDASPRICDAWAEKDSRIRVIHKENAGLGMARNTGIDAATGEFICFIDSDDHIEPDMVESCVRAAREYGADLVSFGNQRVTQNGKVLACRIPTAPKQVFEGDEILQKLLPKALSYDTKTGENWNLSLSACFNFYAMDTITRSGWRFVSEREIISEDFYSLFDLFAHVRRAVILKKSFYHYVVNPKSLTQVYRKDRFQRQKYFYHQMLALSDAMGVQAYTANEIGATFAGLVIGSMKHIVASGERYADKIAMLRQIVCDPDIQNYLRSGDFSGEGRGKKLLWSVIRRKDPHLCYLVVKARNIKDKVSL